MKSLVHVNDKAGITAKLGPSFVSRVQLSKPGVCLILVDTGKSTLQSEGTGFLIAGDLVLTSGHAVFAARSILATQMTGNAANDDSRIKVQFNVAYTAANAAKPKHPQPEKDVEPIRPMYQVTKVLEYLYDEVRGVDDYAILRISRPTNPLPGDHLAPLPIEAASINSPVIPPASGEQPTSSIMYTSNFAGELLSLQHPMGEPMQATTGPAVYFNQQQDTAPLPGPHHFLDMLCYKGSSGSPILDSADRVVAVLLGPSTKAVGKGSAQLCRVMPMDRIYRQSPTVRAILAAAVTYPGVVK